MINLIAIHKLSAQIGLTSRTLRHWESEGLFKSGRDRDSGWRVYDEEAVLKIRITALLRKIDIPINDIKPVTDEKSFEKLCEAAAKRLSYLKTQNQENIISENRIKQFLTLLQTQDSKTISEENLFVLSSFIETIMLCDEKEKYYMSNLKSNEQLKFIILPPMRTAGSKSVGVSPEDDAMNPVIEWIDSAGLAGTARIFGGNLPPMPNGEGKPYGYGVCASIPEGVEIPKHLAEIRLTGGVYAMLESTDDIPASWKKLMKLLSENEKYVQDKSRHCLEEHIKNDKGGYLLNLLTLVNVK